MIENILQTVIGFVDTLFVAKLGLDEVMAVGIANNILVIYMAVFMAIGIGASSLIAKSIGAGNIEAARAAARQATILSALAGILFGMISYFFERAFTPVNGS
ncbi:MATE family efflux transporter [Peribacillus deserti]|uniref:MATE family efflux transporter n=1 Tax=Peribacillus deserti TaxID=673318 RepID=UPI00215238C3|nr:MATE family efflux transporter [Peribacillus deserti]